MLTRWFYLPKAERFVSKQDQLLPHCHSKATPPSRQLQNVLFTSTQYLDGERHCESKVSCPTQCAWSGLELGQFNPESSALTMTSSCLFYMPLTPKSLMEGRCPRSPGAATAITTPRHQNTQLACPTRNQATSPPRQAPLRHPSHSSQIAQWKDNL